ncbi:histidinol-phosphate aminotransferase [Kibdelosporangium banguiense]|uniref:Aromatic amino acid aminotransferase n=1 Tax=Kibdelosporangium banguiense TaxID=1365924 RepID=A0ABS4U194_9PSEU|nr:histidinol-phosphate transaminase [Kibdelosporangium banguiense]MBP2330418.1 histidinol-phosphate aminotransferase [Kibdelosporangium banguiense]
MSRAEEAQVRLRPALAGVPSYQAGRPAPIVDGRIGYKVSSNENAYPPLPSVLQAVRTAAASINRYPDANVTRLRTALAGTLGVPIEHIATGTGSVGVLGQIIQATCDPGDEVLYAWRSFEAYPVVAGIAGACSVQIGLDGQARHRLDAMAGAVTDRTRVILLCTPNNPTGPAIKHDELSEFLDRVPRNVLVVIDEAYAEFVTDPDAANGLRLYRDRPNVALLRTFSKAYGLAGLRVGYAVAHEAVASALRTTATSFGVNSLAEQAALASLAAREELQQRVDAIVAERARVLAGLRDCGWEVPDAQGNFVWLSTAERSNAFSALAKKCGLTVRQFGDEGVRVTIGEAEANDLLITVARQFAGAPAHSLSTHSSPGRSS